MIEDLIRANRSCRRFYQDIAVDIGTLEGLVELARLSASGANRQPLKYILCRDTEKNARIFECLAWAAYLQDWTGPADGERPAAYVVVLGDTAISQDFGCDHGIAAQSILLGARAQGLAGCMLGAIDRKRLRTALDIDTRLQILLVIALGRPKENAVVEAVGPDGSIRYWRDESGLHHVPKRALAEIVFKRF